MVICGVCNPELLFPEVKKRDQIFTIELTYLYSLMQNEGQKISLTELILVFVKCTHELKHYSIFLKVQRKHLLVRHSVFMLLWFLQIISQNKLTAQF